MTESTRMKIGIVGLGAIGGFLLGELKNDSRFEIAGVDDIDREKALSVLAENGFTSDKLINFSDFPEDTDVYIEAASGSIARKVAEFALTRGKIVVIASIGGLGDIDDLKKIAEKTGGRMILPSGAIAGLDALKAIPTESIKSVSLKSTKPSGTLADTPWLKEHGIDCLKLEKSTCVFSGNAREACKAFPKSANVSAALAHATLGLDRVHVEMWADPLSDKNRHSIRVESDHGNLEVEVSNVPFEINPRTSRLAAYSILATIRNLVEPVVVGT